MYALIVLTMGNFTTAGVLQDYPTLEACSAEAKRMVLNSNGKLAPSCMPDTLARHWLTRHSCVPTATLPDGIVAEQCADTRKMLGDGT